MSVKIKRIESIYIGPVLFSIKWDSDTDCGGGSFDYGKMQIVIGIKNSNDGRIFEVLCHELMEICAVEMGVRLQRPDIEDDYIFVYDHRQHATMMSMLGGWLSQFID